MNAAVLDELGERQAGDLAPYRVEAGERHGIRCVVDDQVNPGHGFQRADVAALATDDAPLHLLVGDRDHRGRDLADRVAGVALDGDRENLARLHLCLLAGLHLDDPRAASSFSAHLLLDPLEQQDARFVAGQRGDPLDGGHLFRTQSLDFTLAGICLFLALLQAALPMLALLDLSIEVLFFLSQTPLLRLHFDAELPRVLLRGCQDADGFRFGLEHDGFLFSVGICADFQRAFLSQSTLFSGGVPLECVAQPSAKCAAGN